MTDAEQRTYVRSQSCVFRFTRDEWHEYSNFDRLPAPIEVNDLALWSSEAFYNILKHIRSPATQIAIASASTAKRAKQIARATPLTCPHWDRRRIAAMRLTLRMKLAANPEYIADAFARSGDRPIVEHSNRDTFWGARPDGPDRLTGGNVLGPLWMELREQHANRDPRVHPSHFAEDWIVNARALHFA